MDFLKELFKSETTKKVILFIALGLFFYSMKGMLNLFLLTFLFTYFIYSVQNILTRLLDNYIRLNEKLVTIILYALLYLSLTLIIYKYVPILINQSIAIINEIMSFKYHLKKENNELEQYLYQILNVIDVKSFLKNSSNYLLKVATNVGKISINLFMSLILSMFFMLEKEKIKNFILSFKDSSISKLYDYLKYFAINFLNSFGKVIQAQVLIAFVNSILSAILLSILGFPQILGLAVMIFLFSLIPVAGTILSFIPLGIIAFNIGGFTKVIYVIIIITLLHGLESYVLNPKFMSDKTELPVFIVFAVLIVSEHFMGVWGLLIGIPLFIFILDILNVKFTKK